jgi:hypothetical protein
MVMLAPGTGTTTAPIGDVVRRILRESNHDKGAAVDRLVTLLLDDKDLLYSLAEEIIRIVAPVIIDRTVKHRREAIITALNTGPNAITSFAKGLRDAALDFEIRCGLKLRDAYPRDVRELVGRYQTTIDDALPKIEWLNQIIKGVPEGSRVGEVRTDREAAKLWEKVNARKK